MSFMRHFNNEFVKQSQFNITVICYVLFTVADSAL